MIELLGVIIFLLVVIIVVLLMKLYFLKKDIKEIVCDFEQKLLTDTNTVITISSRDRHVRNLAAGINNQLRVLRKQQLKYANGDKELKAAVTNISHDLRTPLTAICGYMDLLEKEEKTEQVCRYLSFIENRIEAMKHLTEELFRYSVILATEDKLVLENVHINAVLEESIAEFYGALTAHAIEPVVSMTENRIERLANKEALSRVFSNILNNALKYSDGDLEIELKKDGMICFSNTAAGLNEVQVGKLFDRFYTVEAARNSNGLGLSIARTLVEQMGGRIEAKYVDQRLEINLDF